MWSCEGKAAEYLGKLECDPLLLGKMLTLLDKNNQGEVSLSKLRAAWSMYGQPLNTATMLRFQANLAERLDHQERIYLTLLDAIEYLAPDRKLKVSLDASDRD